MSEATKALLEKVLALPPKERESIDESIYESLEIDEEPLTQDDLNPLLNDPEWQAMILRRSDDAHNRPERLIDGELAMARARESLKRFRQQ